MRLVNIIMHLNRRETVGRCFKVAVTRVVEYSANAAQFAKRGRSICIVAV